MLLIPKNFFYSTEARIRIRKEYDIEGKKVFIHVGRFEKQKNHNFIIDVFNEIVQKDHNSVLFVVR